MSSAAYHRLRGIFGRSTSMSTTTTTTKQVKTKTKNQKKSLDTATTTTTNKLVKQKTKNPEKSLAAASTVSLLKTENPIFKPLPMSQLTDSLKNLKNFIDTFKKASNIGTFRYSYTYYEDVVSHLARSKQHSYIEEILEHQKTYKTNISNEQFVVRLISLYGKSRMYDHARKLFDEMPDLNCPRTVLSANALLTACLNSKRLNQIPELFRELREEFCIEPDDISYNIVIKAFCDMDAIDCALHLTTEMEENGCKCSLYTYNTIMDALYKKGNISEANKLWEVMKSKNLEPDVITYNAKVRGLVVGKRISEAIGLLNEMISSGVNPDVYTYNALIHGFVKEDDLVKVKNWYAEMVKNEIVSDTVTFRMIISFASKKGDYKFGFEMCKRSLLSKINVGRLHLQGVLDGLVKESAIDEAMELVELVNGSEFIFFKLKGFADS